MNFINRANSSKLVLPGMVYSIFIIIIIGMKKTHVCIVHSRHLQQFSLNVWAGIIDKLLFNWTFFSRWETNRHKVRWFFEHAFTRNVRGRVPVDIRLCMRFMHDGTPPHFSRVARQFFRHIYIYISNFLFLFIIAQIVHELIGTIPCVEWNNKYCK